MTTEREQTLAYLSEAHTAQLTLARMLRGHIAMTPQGEYRRTLESHANGAERDAERLRGRMTTLGVRRGPVQAGMQTVHSVLELAWSLGTAPLSILRGQSEQQQLVDNVRAERAAAEHAIATFDALEALARELGDTRTAELAAEVRGEGRLLADLTKVTGTLARDAARAEVAGRTHDGASSRAGQDAVRGVQRATQEAQRRAETVARTAATGIQETARQAGGAVDEIAETTREDAQATARQARGSVDETTETAREEARSVAREAQRTAETTGEAARGEHDVEPWPGYDQHTVDQIHQHLTDATPQLARSVGRYERRHKNRTTVLTEADRKAS